MEITREFIVLSDRYGFVKVIQLSDARYFISTPKHGQFSEISSDEFSILSSRYKQS